MRIERVEIYRAEMPMKHPFRIAIGVTEMSQSLFVRLFTDTGIAGLGEANLFTPVVGETLDTAAAAAAMLGRLLVGADPLDIEGRVEAMQRALPFNTTTRSAFDMALWDILGKASNLPLFAVLGGPRRPVLTDNTVGIDTPERMAERAADHKARGFQIVKVKLGEMVETDVERLRCIRAAVGPDHVLRIDANQGWSRVDARRALTALAAFEPQFCEQPLARWDIDGLAALKKVSPIPLMADESVFDAPDALRLVQGAVCDHINIKLAKSGGIHTALKINAIAEAGGISCMIGCMTESGIGLSAAVHLASARHNIVFADLDGADMLAVDPVEGGFAYTARGELLPSTRPGLGVEIAPDFLAQLPVTIIA